MADSPQVSVIIASRNRREMLAVCLESLYSTICETPFEVVVVDDASTDGTAELLAERFPAVQVIRRETPASWTVTNNQGVAQSRGSLLLLLNDDTKLLEGTVDRAVAFLREHPQAGVVTPVILNVDGSIQPTVRHFPSLGQALAQSLDLHRLLPGNKVTGRYYGAEFDYSRTQPAESVGSTCYLMRRKCYEAIGGFDESFPPNFSDLEMNWRVREAGWEIWVLAEAQVIHYGGATLGLLNLRQIGEFHRGMLRMYRKHYAPRRPPLVNGLVYLGIGARYLLKAFLRVTALDRLVNRLPSPHRRR